MQDLINILERKSLIWHGAQKKHNETPNDTYISSGYPALDKKLNGGFPKEGVVDIDTDMGIGELRLLLPCLSTSTRLVVFINPPHHINTHCFHHLGFDSSKLLIVTPSTKNDALWAAEQCLKSGACSHVLLWQSDIEIHQVKRLQLASEKGNALQFLLRMGKQYAISLPVPLSMSLSADDYGLNISVSKRKGGWPLPEFSLDMSKKWPSLTMPPRGDNVVLFARNKAV